MGKIIITENGSKLLVNHILQESDLTASEKRIWSMKDVVLKSIGGLPVGYSNIYLVDAIRYYDDSSLVEGLCDFRKGEIFICRACLFRAESFIGTLLHEIAHARSGANDETKKFESELSDLLGYIGTSLVESVNNVVDKVHTSQSLECCSFGYAKLRCMSCFSTEFNVNNTNGTVECDCCKRVYESQQALINLNRQYIEEHGVRLFLGDIL